MLIASARDITLNAFPPRAVFVNYPLGNTTGKPFDPGNQTAILRAALEVLESATRAGQIVDLPYVWRADEGWMEQVYGDNHESDAPQRI